MLIPNSVVNKSTNRGVKVLDTGMPANTYRRYYEIKKSSFYKHYNNSWFPKQLPVDVKIIGWNLTGGQDIYTISKCLPTSYSL